MTTPTGIDLPTLGDCVIHHDDLPWRIYRFRLLGMGLSLLPIATVLHELDAGWPYWAWVLFCCLAWPHLAYLAARFGKDRFRGELRNLRIDSAIAGSMAAAMHFNLLPTVMLLVVVTADKINSGIRRLWLISLPWMLCAIILGGLLTGFAWHPDTSMKVIISCLPLMVIHTLACSLGSYRLIRQAHKQNQRLNDLTRNDALTGLESREYWSRQAESMRRLGVSSARPCTLLLIDVDRFKQINDAHGHGVGDDVLRSVAVTIADALPTGAHAGRFGGDEFVVVLPLAIETALATAQRFLAGIRQLRFDASRSLTCTVSIGVAELTPSLGLREWLEAADRALYIAKAEGRDRASIADTRPPGKDISDTA